MSIVTAMRETEKYVAGAIRGVGDWYAQNEPTYFARSARDYERIFDPEAVVRRVAEALCTAQCGGESTLDEQARAAIAAYEALP